MLGLAPAIAFSLAMSACAPSVAPAGQPATTVEMEEAVPEASPSVAPLPTEGVGALPDETATVRLDQYATDPASVNLAAGRPTLVKFFAFW
jgi:hypothetical protein